MVVRGEELNMIRVEDEHKIESWSKLRFRNALTQTGVLFTNLVTLFAQKTRNRSWLLGNWWTWVTYSEKLPYLDKGKSVLSSLHPYCTRSFKPSCRNYLSLYNGGILLETTCAFPYER